MKVNCIVLSIFLVSIYACKPSTTTVVKSDGSADGQAKESGITDYYKCFSENDIKDLQMSVSFDAYDNALEVTYKGQTEASILVYLDEEVIKEGEPEVRTKYKALRKAEETGTYIFTPSGDLDLVKYLRKEDGEEFNFTIDLDQSMSGGGYRTTPCH